MRCLRVYRHHACRGTGHELRSCSTFIAATNNAEDGQPIFTSAYTCLHPHLPTRPGYIELHTECTRASSRYTPATYNPPTILKHANQFKLYTNIHVPTFLLGIQTYISPPPLSQYRNTSTKQNWHPFSSLFNKYLRPTRKKAEQCPCTLSIP